MPVQCFVICTSAHELLYVQSNVISGGFLKVESLDFWMTPSPKHSLRKMTREKAGVEFR